MLTKNCLLIGCGSKFGLELSQYLHCTGYNIHSISGSTSSHENINHLQVDWKNLNVAQLEKFLRTLPKFDLVFFNQNSSALNSTNFFSKKSTLELWKLEKNWTQSYFISCILPFHIIHTLNVLCNENTKVCWMLSPLVYRHNDDQIGFADYIGNKYQNYLILKNFSKHHRSNFIGLNPDKLLTTNNDVRINNMIAFIQLAGMETSGRVFFLDGTEDTQFNEKFNN